MDVENIISKDPDNQHQGQITIHRSVLSIEDLEKLYLQERTNRSCLDSIKQMFVSARAKCTPETCLRAVRTKLPVMNVIKSYNIKKFLVLDLLAGLCVAMLNIPECLGYAVLAGLPPVYGLYTSFYPILVYFILGTSRHLNLGTMAITSLLIRGVVDREAELLTHLFDEMKINETATGPTALEFQEYRVNVAVSLAFIVGVMQLGMALLQFGLLSDFMSPQFTDAFLSGCGFLIVTSQVPYLFGISKQIPSESGKFTFLKTWYWIFRKLPKTNPADFIIGLICCVLLFSIKDVLNEKLKKKLPLPIPAELIVVVAVTLASYYGKFSKKYHIPIVNHIPKGLPTPQIPRFPNASDYVIDGFIIAIISFVVNMSQARVMARKHCYTIEPNQELLAYGACQLITSIFGGFAGASAPPRLFVQDSAGGKTQLCSVVSALVALLVCLVLGPLFEPLPMAALAAVVVIPLIPLFTVLRNIPSLWRKDKYDCCVFVVTLLVVVLVEVDIGLGVGIGVSLLTVILRSRIVKATILRPVMISDAHCPDLFAKEKRCKTSDDRMRGIIIIKFDCILYFANVNSFVQQIYKLSVNPIKQKSVLRRAETDPVIAANTSPILVLTSAVPQTGDLEENNDGGKVVWSEMDCEEPYTIDLHYRCSGVDNQTYESDVTEDVSDRPKAEYNLRGNEDYRTNGHGANGFSSCHAGSETRESNGFPRGEQIHVISSSVARADEDFSFNTKDRAKLTKFVILDCSSISRIDSNGAVAIKQLRADYDNVNISLWLAACPMGMIDVLRGNDVDLSKGVFPSIQDAIQAATTALRQENLRGYNAEL